MIKTRMEGGNKTSKNSRKQVNNNTQTIIIAVIVALVVLFLFGGLGMFGMGFGSYGMFGMVSGLDSGSWFGFMWIFGLLFMTLVIVALVLLIAWLIKQLQK